MVGAFANPLAGLGLRFMGDMIECQPCVVQELFGVLSGVAGCTCAVCGLRQGDALLDVHEVVPRSMPGYVRTYQGAVGMSCMC